MKNTIITLCAFIAIFTAQAQRTQYHENGYFLQLSGGSYTYSIAALTDALEDRGYGRFAHPDASYQTIQVKSMYKAGNLMFGGSLFGSIPNTTETVFHRYRMFSYGGQIELGYPIIGRNDMISHIGLGIGYQFLNFKYWLKDRETHTIFKSDNAETKAIETAKYKASGSYAEVKYAFFRNLTGKRNWTGIGFSVGYKYSISGKWKLSDDDCVTCKAGYDYNEDLSGMFVSVELGIGKY